jgi:hypothetical protein
VVAKYTFSRRVATEFCRLPTLSFRPQGKTRCRGCFLRQHSLARPSDSIFKQQAQLRISAVRSTRVLLQFPALSYRRGRGKTGHRLAPAIRGQNAHGRSRAAGHPVFPRDGFTIYRTWQEGAASVSIPPWIHAHGDSTCIRIRPNVKTSVFHCRGHPRDLRVGLMCACQRSHPGTFYSATQRCPRPPLPGPHI